MPDPAENGGQRWARARRHWRHEPRGREIPISGASKSDARAFLRYLFRNAPAPKPVGAYFDPPRRGRRSRHCATSGPRASKKYIFVFAQYRYTYVQNIAPNGAQQEARDREQIHRVDYENVPAY